jgi:methylated-DNA-protein-cysteine methyltransferase-like protein
MPPSDERDYYERIYKVVNQIPRGQVATYGDIAAIVGDGCDGRIVGHALGALGANSMKVAWQRVIGRNGKITTSGLHQPDKLAAEGVKFDERGYVLMSQFHWAGPSEEWAKANGFQLLPKGGASEEPDNQLSLF